MPDFHWYDETLTQTWVPRYARALTDVVRAFEDCNVRKLTEALDAADPALLNRHPKVQYAPWIHNRISANGWCFFNAWGVALTGENPLSLLSCATWVLVNHIYDPNNLVGRANDRNDFLEVYEVLVNHPKVDINAHTPYVDYCRERQRLLAECDLRCCAPGTCRHIDDCLPAFDYALEALVNQDREEDCCYLQAVVAILVRSGKLNVDRCICRWHPHQTFHFNEEYDRVLHYFWNFGETTYELFKEVLERYDAAIMDARNLRPHLRERINIGHSDYMDREIVVAIDKRLAQYERVRVLTYVRRVARTRILLGRAWKEARVSVWFL